MAFPNTVVTDNESAGALLTNNAAAAGLSVSGLQSQAQIQVVLANLLKDTPAATNITGASIQSSSGTGGIGYSTGAGGAAVQGTDKSTAVIINKLSGQITLNNASLGAGAEAIFTVTNSSILTGDVPHVIHASAGTAGAYMVQACNIVTGTSFQITVTNLSAGALAEAIVLNFVVFRGVSS